MSTNLARPTRRRFVLAQMEINGNVIRPQRRTAPFLVGTRDFASWVAGAVGTTSNDPASVEVSS